MELRSNCHLCDPPDTGKHLYWNSQTECWYCFRCGGGGRGPNPGSDPHVPHRTFPTIRVSKDAKLLHDLMLNSNSVVVSTAVSYLRKHHIDPERVAFERRLLIDGTAIVFPVYRGNDMIYFQKRDVFTKQFYNPNIETKPLFWTDDEGDRCVLVESFLNACRIDKWVTGCCVFGKFLSDEGAEEIAARCKVVDVILDAGESAAALKIARKLRHYGVRFVAHKSIMAPQGTDVCELNDIQCRRLLGV